MIRAVETSTRARIAPLVALAAMLAFAPAAHADPYKATTSRKARDEARRSVPLESVDARFRENVGDVLAKPSIFRRLPIQSVESDPEMFTFLASNPDVIINIWRLMKVTKMQMHRVSDTTFVADDRAGTKTRFDYVLSSPGMQVIYAEGAYDGPLVRKPIRARCVLVLKSALSRDAAGRQKVTTRMDTFVKVDHLGAAAVAKTLQPLIGRSADYNFRETVSFIGQLSRTSQANPDGIGRLADRLTQVRPDVRDRFAQVAGSVGNRAEQSTASAGRTATSRPTVSSRN